MKHESTTIESTLSPSGFLNEYYMTVRVENINKNPSIVITRHGEYSETIRFKDIEELMSVVEAAKNLMERFL